VSQGPIGPILRPQRRLIVVAGIAMVAATAVTLTAPILAKIAIDRGINGNDPHVIDVVAVVFLILVLIRPVLERVIVLASARAGERFLGGLRVAAFDKLQALSMPFFEETRAGVLREIAENDRFKAAELNRAFVLMEYFGYLRRDPDAAPNTDFSGYNFWLAKLNSFGGDFHAAEMVRAFIESTEYRKRFGP